MGNTNTPFEDVDVSLYLHNSWWISIEKVQAGFWCQNLCETTSKPWESASISACIANKIFHQNSWKQGHKSYLPLWYDFQKCWVCFLGLIEIAATGRWLNYWVFAQRFTQKCEKTFYILSLRKKDPWVYHSKNTTSSLPGPEVFLWCSLPSEDPERIFWWTELLIESMRSDLDKFLRIRLWVAKVHEECVLFDLKSSTR